MCCLGKTSILIVLSELKESYENETSPPNDLKIFLKKQITSD